MNLRCEQNCDYTNSLTLADPEHQKRGGTFLPKFLNDLLLGVFRKTFSISPKMSSISQNFWWPFLVIDLFHVLMCYFSVGGAKSVADIDTGAKILTFRQIHNAIITLSAPKGGQTPLPTSIGAWPDFHPPLDPPMLPQGPYTVYLKGMLINTLCITSKRKRSKN